MPVNRFRSLEIHRSLLYCLLYSNKMHPLRNIYTLFNVVFSATCFGSDCTIISKLQFKGLYEIVTVHYTYRQ